MSTNLSEFAILYLQFLLALLPNFTPAVALSATELDWTAKVDPWVAASVASGATAEFVVFLKEQADLSGAATLPTKGEKGYYVFSQLTALAERSQEPVLNEIRARGLLHRPYWIANMIWVTGSQADVAALASRNDVHRINANPLTALEKSQLMSDQHRIGGPEASLVHIGATDLWAAGFTGQGVVVAGADTGYDWTHPALRDQYRGWDGSSETHDYNWHDSIHSGGGICGADSPFPCDDNNHGTHTMGTMAGDDGGSNQIGVAPGARWIGCRNMDQGNGTPITYSECFQFFLAPTDLNDQNPNPLLAPDVINGSWSCPDFEGCTDPEVLRTVVENVRAAGMVVVQSAGNAGSGCSTVDTPAAIYDAAFTIGAVDLSDQIASFSSRGPVAIDGSNRLKPNVSAPGVGIRSSVLGDSYSTFNGTSMAAPHVAGVIALLISADPSLSGHPDALEQHLMDTAVDGVTVAQSCGGTPDTVFPNNTYGYGSVRAAIPTNLFADGFESGDTTLWSATLP